MLVDCLFIVLVSIFTSFLAEGISWLLIYRTESYQKLRSTIDKTAKKLEKSKDSVVDVTKQKSKGKKVQRQEENLKNSNTSMTYVKMKSFFAVGFTMVTIFGLLNSHFDGRVVAKLPFQPLSLISGITHRNLLGKDLTDCAMVFVYILCSMSFRSNIQKLLGFAPPKGASNLSLFPTPK